MLAVKSLTKPVVITGGGGFIGSNLTRKLLALGYQTHILVHNKSNLWRLNDVKNEILLHSVDIRDKKIVDLMKKISPFAVFHLATYSSYRNQMDVREMADVAFNGTLNLLMATKDIPYKIFVNTGSSSEYGFKDKPMKENDLLEPISFYAATKAGQTHLCNVFSSQYGKSITTIRPFSVYGPYEQKDRFIPTIIRSLISGKPIKLTAGEQRRDFIYIDDLIEVYTKTLEYTEDLVGKILNAGTGIEYTNDQVVDALFKVTGKTVLIEKGKFPKRIWDTPHWVADITQAKRLINWEPKFSIEKGLLATYNWNIKNGQV